MKKATRWFSRNLIRIYAVIGFAYLFLPIIYTFVFSFNRSKKSNLVWVGFTFNNWLNPCGAPDVCNALGNSLKIGVLATFFATVLGTLMAFAMGRYAFKGRSVVNILIFLPMATPEVVLGASLLALYLNLKLPLGFWTILIAHIMFTISFIVVAVKARLQGMDPRLEEAAQDLYASPWQTFRFVTFPLVLPGILGAALLGFSLSFDDFIISNFASGTTVTFPIFIWGAAQRGIPVQVYALATLVFTLALVGTVLGQIVSSRRRRKLATSS